MLRRIAFGVAVLGLLGACSAESDAGKQEAVDETTQEFGLRDTKIAGSLSYGETSVIKFQAKSEVTKAVK